MRVITGTARGVPLAAPAGYDTRPTADRVKEALFSVIQFEIEGRRVLDLVAGSGQLGIEALSRGAARCVFVDSAQPAVKLVRENLRRTKLEARAQVLQRRAEDYLEGCRETFDLIFLDPPYAGDALENCLNRLAAIDIVAKNGIIVCERPAERQLAFSAARWERSRDYRYGKTLLTFLRNAAQ